MAKFGKVLFGGLLVGAAALAGYKFLNKYAELNTDAPNDGESIPETGAEEPARNYTTVEFDVDTAKEAAKQTYDSIMTGARKAWDVTKESAKTIYDSVMENYGDSINAAKEKAEEGIEYVKTQAAEKFEDVKVQATETFDDVKEQFTAKYEIPVESVQEEIPLETMKEEIPETYETAYEPVVESIVEPVVEPYVEAVTETTEEKFPEEEVFQTDGFVDPYRGAYFTGVNDTTESQEDEISIDELISKDPKVENTIYDIQNQAEDFVQRL